jgi:tRNA 2-thiouridine synthesizing protein A
LPQRPLDGKRGNPFRRSALDDHLPDYGQPGSGQRLDARGHHCPVPTLRLRRALEALPPGDVVCLLADDPMARIDVPHFVSQAGHDLLDSRSVGTSLEFVVRKRL